MGTCPGSGAPDGLSCGELIALLRPLLASGLAPGMEITIFGPDLDPGGSIARAFTQAIVAAFDGAPVGRGAAARATRR